MFRYKEIILSFFFHFLCSLSVESQKAEPSIVIRKVSSNIILDGLHDEPDWQLAHKVSDFYMNYPYDTAKTTWQTEVRMCFDNKKLYIALRCYEKKEDYIIQSLKRDFGPGTSDVINVEIDAYRDGLNGLIFSVNPLNVQREGSINEGDDLDLNWDNKWYSAVKNVFITA